MKKSCRTRETKRVAICIHLWGAVMSWQDYRIIKIKPWIYYLRNYHKISIIKPKSIQRVQTINEINNLRKKMC